MRILVTGGAGFIGSHLTDSLIEQGHLVIVVDNLSNGKKENLDSSYFSGAKPENKFYNTDIQSPDISRIFQNEKPDIVFHLAAQISVRKSVEEPIQDAETNILGALNILENCRKHKVKKIIFASSGGAIHGEAQTVPTSEEEPTQALSPYAIAKLTIEQYLDYYHQIFNLPFVSLRLANVYGPRQNSEGGGVVMIFIDELLKGSKPIIFGTGTQTRDFIYIDDVVGATLEVLNYTGCDHVIYNIGTGIETKISDIYQLITKNLGKDIVPIFGPSKTEDLKRSCLDGSKIKRELGWQPRYTLDQGLKKTINWFKKHYARKL